MKKVLYIIFSLGYLTLFAQEIKTVESVEKATQLEMFLFKIGFTSMLNEFENEKNITKLNTTNIKELKANVQYILQQMNKDKLNEIGTISTINTNNDNSELVKEISLLRDELAQLKANIKKEKKISKIYSKKQTVKILNNITIKVKEANVRKEPFLNSQVIRKITFGKIVKVESCNKYGWCKLEKRDEYIAKFLLQGF